MIIYNVTLKIDWSIHDAWIEWMKQKHIPDVMRTGCFTENRLVRILEIDETDGPTYAAQYHANSHTEYDRYVEMFAPDLRKELLDCWSNKVIAFRSLMEVVN